MAVPFARTTRSLASHTSRFALVAWSLAGVLLLAWLAWFFLGGVTVYEVSRQARIEVQQSAHPVATLVPGRVVSSALALGQPVRAGDVLVELDATTERLRLREEQSRLAAMPGRLESIRRELAALERAKGEELQSAVAAAQAARSRGREAAAAVEFARENERRLKEESAFGGVAKVDALRASSESQKLAASSEALAAEVRRLELDAQTRAHGRDAEIEALRRTQVALEGERATAQAATERLQQDIERRTVRAPVAGVVGDLAALRVGTYVAEGQKLATVVPGGGLIAVADFPPAVVLGRVRPGMPARLRLDGFPWAQFGTIEARVSHVAGEIRDNAVRVELALPAPAPGIALQHGLPGSVEIAVEQTSPAVLVLRAAGQMTSRPQQATETAQAVPEAAARPAR
jgi:membrane fusion protein (multidrug efflux system)